MQLKYVLFLVAFAVAEKQIKLEDIERDNLLSERQVSAKPDEVDEQAQNLQPPPPPSALQAAGASYEVSTRNKQPDNSILPYCLVFTFRLEFRRKCERTKRIERRH